MLLFEDILTLLMFFTPAMTGFALTLFAPLLQPSQTVRVLFIGLANGVIAALIFGLAMLRGVIGIQGVLFSIGLAFIIGALLSLVTASDSIAEEIGCFAVMSCSRLSSCLTAAIHSRLLCGTKSGREL
jgi:hypothetical protein